MTVHSYYEDQALRIGTGTQLLIDDALVEDRFNLKRVLNKPVKEVHNPILQADKPWECRNVSCPVVIYDEERGQYRMWYTVFDSDSYYGGHGAAYATCYAESDDGFQWQKLLLSAVTHPKYEKTNIVYQGEHANPKNGRLDSATSQVFKDLDESDPAQRYKMINLTGRLNPQYPDDVNAVPSLVCSPDGIHWKLSQNPPILDQHSDTSNHVVYDAIRERWLFYCRPTIFSSGRMGGEGGVHRHKGRRICVMTSKDFIKWSYPRIVMYPDDLDLPDYDQMRVFRYGSHFLMFYSAMDGGNLGRVEVKIASSTDGIHWERFQTREAFLPRGEAGLWDAGGTDIRCEPIANGDNLLFYYSGSGQGQMEQFVSGKMRTGNIGIASIKKDRFVAVRASDGLGYLLTKEFVLEGSELFVNILSDVRPGKNPILRVEVLRHPPLGEHTKWYYTEHQYSYHYEGFGFEECKAVGGDHTGIRISWKDKNLAELKDKRIYLRFEMQDIDLYSFRIDE